MRKRRKARRGEGGRREEEGEGGGEEGRRGEGDAEKLFIARLASPFLPITAAGSL